MNNISLKSKVTGILMAALLVTGCGNFDKINTNPDKPTDVNSAWLATSMLNSVTKSTIGGTKSFVLPHNLSKYLLWTETVAGIQYNDLGRADFDIKMTPLRNINDMVAKAPTEEQKASYTALGHFLRAWQFFHTTILVGDIPYSEAVRGKEGIIKPKYDTQKDVFIGILDELDKANTLFSTGGRFDGDFIYKGDTDKWRRLVNSFQLYVLINLDKKTADTDLKVAIKFKEVSERPLMRDHNDNFAIVFNGSRGYCYPWSNTPADVNPYTNAPMLSSDFIDMLKANQDRRLFLVAEPSERLLMAGKLESDFNAYEGVDPKLKYDETTVIKGRGEYSKFNKRYVDNATAEPVGLICHWDIQLILAEAALKGWITGAAEDYYSAGIKSSMNFYTTHVDASYTHSMSMDEAYINAYPATVALAGSTDDKLKQIICQKYLAGFLHNEHHAWFEFRRTGFPEFTVNPDSNQNPTDNTKFPTKWLYPKNEVDYNRVNLNEAVERQYGGSDDHNGTMWILK